MKKLSLLLMLCLIAMSLSACTNKPEDLGEAYLLGQDFQFYFDPTMNFAESEDAYYFLGPHAVYLCSKSKETGETVVLCNKADCLHDKEEDATRTAYCNAMMMEYSGGLQYYQDKLYLAGSSSDNPSIIEVSTDGSGYKEILAPESMIMVFAVHRGHLYVSYSDFLSAPENINEEELSSMRYWVERYDLSNPSGKSETIYEKTGVYGQINSMSAYGNSLIIRESLYEDLSNTEEFTGATKVYDIINETTETLPYQIGSTIAVADNKMFFYEKAGDQIADYEGKSMLIVDMQLEKVGELPIKYMSKILSNGNLFFIDNVSSVIFNEFDRDERALNIYDTEGTLLSEVPMDSETLPPIGGNQDYYFYLGYPSDDEGPYTIWAIDLNDLDNPDLKGELFYEYIPTTNFPGVVVLW